MMRAAVTGIAAVLAIGLVTPGAYAQNKAPSTVSQQRLAELRDALAAKGIVDKAAARNWASKHAIPLRRDPLQAGLHGGQDPLDGGGDPLPRV